MKKKNNNLSFTGLLYFLFLFQSCNKISDKNIKVISIPNDSIKGQAFIGESNSAVKYSPKGNFIQVIQLDSGIWTNLILKKSEKELQSKLFFHDDEITVSLIYDNLNIGEYDLKFVSDLKDTITDKLNFEKSIELKFPAKLKEFYNEKNIKNLNVDKLTKSDTLQILYKNLGCFGGSINLIEFFIDDKNKMTFRKKISGTRNGNEPKDQWIYSYNKNIKENLNQFVSNIKKLDMNNKNYCSSQVDYIFRVKGKKTIYWVKDKTCKLREDIDELIKIKK